MMAKHPRTKKWEKVVMDDRGESGYVVAFDNGDEFQEHQVELREPTKKELETENES